MVTTAVVLGSVVRGGQSGARSAGVQISTASAAEAAAGAASESPARNPRVGRGLLALVDAAADERDVEDDRALAAEEEATEADDGKSA